LNVRSLDRCTDFQNGAEKSQSRRGPAVAQIVLVQEVRELLADRQRLLQIVLGDDRYRIPPIRKVSG
jgi:hypothetical protein